jgi:5-methyltetrahydrofolate--homocysteine methyltransferase
MHRSIKEKPSRLRETAKKRILVLDGAMGTAIQNHDLTVEDFGGAALEGCNEYLVITRPDVISGIHEKYLASGCDIVETNTFGGTPLVLDEYGLGERAYELNLAATRLARKAADKFSTPEKPRFVAGSIGPTTKAISVTGGVTFEQLIQNFYEQSKGLWDGGSDYFLIETCQDTRNIKAAILGAQKLFEEKGESIPLAVSVTIEQMGTMLAGQAIDAVVASLSNTDLLYLGLNCATGPEFMTDHVRTLAEISPFPIGCVPNAGLPDENGRYLETPKMMCQVLSRFIESGWVNFIGGCCGTCADHIAEFVKLAEGKAPRQAKVASRSDLSGIEYLEITDDLRPVIVGERTNVIGSKKFKKLICDEKFEEASEIARLQVKNGAHIIDLCLANPDRDEMSDMQKFLEKVIHKVKVPLMIDSTDAKVIEMALTYCQGKAIINSVNLEDGEERFELVVPLAKKFGAALVVGTIDEDPEQGMGVTRARKLAIAERSFDLLTNKYGIKAEDIYWDPLVFPCATGDAQYIGSAVETIEGIRAIKKRFPQTKTVLGISNVSFGLPNAGREVLNSVFLYHCVQAGLDLAIVNSEKLERYASIPEEEKKLSEDLLYNRNPDAIAAFAAQFRDRKTTIKKSKSDLTLDQRLGQYIIEGSKDGLVQDLDLAMKDRRPLEIINGPLMAGMDEVGKLFNANKLIVAEVLQSAEAMKAAVSHLEPFMEKAESSVRGKIILATVKGDVHDIGKNLVDIILSNNGFKVVNLGIKVPPDALIRAIQEHKPDIVGLSGLLVKSAQQMVITVDDFSRAGIKTPILVGGAALSSNFVDKQIARNYPTGTVAYANDAMHGLELAKNIVNPEQFEKLRKNLEEKRKITQAQAPAAPQAKQPVRTERSAAVPILKDIPQPDSFDRRQWVDSPKIDLIWNYINPMMLYGRHLGIKGPVVRLLTEAGSDKAVRRRIEETDPKALGIWDTVEELKAAYRGKPVMQPAAVWQFFRASSEGNSIHLYEGNGKSQPRMTFTFPRQAKDHQLCLADYVCPSLESNDNVAFFVVSVGRGLREIAEELKARGEYLKSHIIQALALESAEAFAEYLHSQVRRIWGYPDAPNMTMLERFQGRYHGKRYSFGYPACPDLSDQKKLFELLDPSTIKVELTEGDMMEPEASVSAMVFHHPSASYFSVGQSLSGDAT